MSEMSKKAGPDSAADSSPIVAASSGARPLWRQPLVLASGAAALLAVCGIGLMIDSAEKLDGRLDAESSQARVTTALEKTAPPPSAPMTPPKPASESQPAARAEAKPSAPVNPSGSENSSASSKPRDAAAEKNDWLRCDVNGEPCEVTLADGTVLKLDTYGATYEGYDFRPPVDVSVAAETVVDYAKMDRHVELYAIQIDAADRKMYWIEMHGDKWQKLTSANLNGEDVKIIVSIDFQSPMGLALDTVNRKIYWTTNAPFPAFGKPASSTRAIWRANFDGSDPEPIFGGLNMARAVAVDPASEGIFYFDESRLIRGALDGTGEKLILDQVARGLHYPAWWTAIDPARHKLYWAGDGMAIATVNFDGSGFAVPVDFHGHVSGIALDLRNGKMYWTERAYQEIWRANLDGSQREAIAIRLRLPRGIDLDADGNAYWTDYKPSGSSNIGRIQRIKLPPVLEPTVKPAPPLINAISPRSQRPGREVTLLGARFMGATQVQFIGEDGKRSDAKFRVKSDTEISVVVPETDSHGRRAAIVVQTPGGVTVTLPRDSEIEQPRGAPTSRQPGFDRFRDAGKLAFVVAPGAWLSGVENSLVYCPKKAMANAGTRGGAVLFLKDDAVALVNDAERTVIYHEPFAQVRRRAKAAADATFVAVPAIRPSFVESLFQIQAAE